MGPRVVATLLLCGLVLAAEGRTLPKGKEEEDKDGDVGTLYFYDQRQNGTYNIQIHLKDVEVLALLGTDSEDYSDSYDEYSYEYHDPVETPYNSTLTPPPEPASSTASNATSTAEPCDTPSTTTATTTASTTTTETTVATSTGKTASGRRRCRPGYTRREGGGCKRTAPGGRPLLALPFGLRMAQRHSDHVRNHVRDRANFKPPSHD